MKRRLDPRVWRLLAALIALAVVFGLRYGWTWFWGKDFHWRQEMLDCLLWIGCIWLLAGSFFPVYEELPEVPPHRHHLRLRYTGDADGFRIVCDDCHASFALSRGISICMEFGIFAMLVIFAIIGIKSDLSSYTRAYMAVYLVPAMFSVHLVTWLCLRRKPAESLLSLKDREKVSLDDSQAETAD